MRLRHLVLTDHLAALGLVLFVLGAALISAALLTWTP